MILQFGVLFSNFLGGVASRVLPTLASAGLNIGNQFVTGLVNRELGRDAANAVQDQVKAQLRAAANAISPLVAPGQTAVFSGGPPTGSAFRPPTLIPPSIQPPQRVLQIDPGLVNPVVSNSFAFSRRPPGAFQGQPTEFRGLTQPAFAGGALLGAGSAVIRGLGAIGSGLGRFGGFGKGLPRQMAGVTGGAIAVETAAAVAADAIFNPSIAFTDREGFPSNGTALRIGGTMASDVIAPMPTGLPGIGRFQKDATGCRVQWYFFNGQQMEPIDRGQAECVKRDCIFRLDVFRGKFIKLKSRRINPMNVRAFFRAGRRVDAGERICRKMFSEHRKTKTGTVRRKKTRKKR